MSLSRRNLLGGAVGLSGALLARPALAVPAADKTTVVVVNLPGGLHSLHAQADSFVPGGYFGCTAANTRDVGSGVVVDTETFGTLPAEALAHMCNVGVWHGLTAHDIAQTALMIDAGAQSYPLQLARALGGDSPVACANLGLLVGRHAPIGSTGVSKLSDAGGILAALGAGPTGEQLPSRGPALAGLKASLRMSAPTLARNQRSLESLTTGLSGVVRALSAPPVAVDWNATASAYGIDPANTAITGFRSQFAAAELLVHAGTNVVLISAGGLDCSLGWDTHSDSSGACAREQMRQLVMPSLRTFLSRTLALPGHQVITALMGDFTRSDNSDHSGVLVATAWGPRLKQGTTGNFTVDPMTRGYVPRGGATPGGIKQFWSFLAAAAGASVNPFGQNPHPFV